MTNSNRKTSGWITSFEARLAKAARQQLDYPAATAKKMNKDFQSAFKFFKLINQSAHEHNLLTLESAKTIKAFESARTAETINELLPELERHVGQVNSRLEGVLALIRKTKRLRATLRSLKLTVEVTKASPILGLATLTKRADDLNDQLTGLMVTAQNQKIELQNLSDLAQWNLKVAVPKQQIASGFSEIGVKQLFAIAYGTQAPRVTRRAALAALSRWAKSIDRVALTHLFDQHLEFAKTKRTLDKVASLNFIAYESARRIAGQQEKGEEYFVLLESLRIDAGAQAADNLLWIANFVGKLESTVFGENTDHEVQLAWINHSLEASGYAPISVESGEGPSLDRVASVASPVANAKALPLVSVILPAFNSEKWISAAIQSLLAQTWTNLEILVVDDCSTDSTYSIAKSFEALDHRVRVLRAKQNSGPYHCRNIALKQAKGDYVTVHDADDWSHPQKIEVQVRHLEADSALMANVSEGARLDESSLITGVAGRTQILRPNFSSLMFRREPVTRALGFWDEVRFGGDSEFQYRLINRFGAESFVILKSGLLSLLRVVEGSLTAGGLQEILSGPRKLYKESFQAWHNHLVETEGSFYLDPTKARRFYAPKASLNIESQPSTRDLVIVANFAEPISTMQPVVALISEALKNSLKLTIAHVPSLDNLASRASFEIETFALENSIDMAWHEERELEAGTPIRSTGLMATSGSVSVKFDKLPKIEAHEYSILVDNRELIEPKALALLSKNFLAMFGNEAKVLSFGDDSTTAVRDLKWLNDIASGDSSISSSNKRNSKSEL